MTRPTLSLLFPQWQGSSLPEPKGLASGATRLRTFFPTRDFLEVEVDASERVAGEAVSGVEFHASVLRQATAARHILETAQPERLLTLGGDCSVDLAPVAYLNERYDDLALLWLDAHPDLNTPDTSPSGALHGMVLRLLLGEGEPGLLAGVKKPLEPGQVFLAGVRDFDPPERAYADSVGLWQISVADLEVRPERLIEAIEARGFGRLHLHFDLDVLDPAAFAATGYPTAEGLSLEGATRLLTLLEASFEVVGVTLTEYLPQGPDEASERAVLETLTGHLPQL